MAEPLHDSVPLRAAALQQAHVIGIQENHQVFLSSFSRSDSRYSLPSRTASSKPSLWAKDPNIRSHQGTAVADLLAAKTCFSSASSFSTRVNRSSNVSIGMALTSTLQYA